MQVIEGRVVLGERACRCCHSFPAGKAAGKKPCEACSGTGRGKRGKEGGCKECYGSKTRPDFVNLITCDYCEGAGVVAETECDNIGSADYQAIPVQVVREDRGSTWAEEYLPFGCVYSVIDYGRSWPLTDEAIIEKMHAEANYVQVCKVSRDLVIADAILILVHRQGYTVKAAFGK